MNPIVAPIYSNANTASDESTTMAELAQPNRLETPNIRKRKRDKSISGPLAVDQAAGPKSAKRHDARLKTGTRKSEK